MDMNQSNRSDKSFKPNWSVMTPWVVAGLCLAIAVVFIVMWVMKQASCHAGPNVVCDAAGNCQCTKDCKCTPKDGNVTCQNNVCSCTNTHQCQAGPNVTCDDQGNCTCSTEPQCKAGTNVTCDDEGNCQVVDPGDWQGECPSACTLSNLCPRCYSGKQDAYDPRNTQDKCYATKLDAQDDNFSTPCNCDLGKPIRDGSCSGNPQGWKYSVDGNQFVCQK